MDYFRDVSLRQTQREGAMSNTSRPPERLYLDLTASSHRQSSTLILHFVANRLALWRSTQHTQAASQLAARPRRLA